VPCVGAVVSPPRVPPEVPDVFTSFLYEAAPIGITRASWRIAL
jgi:hypothetical protein